MQAFCKTYLQVWTSCMVTRNVVDVEVASDLCLKQRSDRAEEASCTVGEDDVNEVRFTQVMQHPSGAKRRSSHRLLAPVLLSF